MKEQRWMNGDVYFGDPDKSPPDWRKEETKSDTEDDEPPSAEERAAVVAMLGFDPAEAKDEEDKQPVDADS